MAEGTQIGERTGPPPPSASGGFNAKMMGLPTWAWIALAAAGGIVFFIWKNKQSASASDGSNAVNVNGVDAETLNTIESQIRDIQGALSIDPTTAGQTPVVGDPTTQVPGGDKGEAHPTQPAPGSKRGYGWHKVSKGEGPSGIAKQYGISTAEFYGFNGPGALKAGEYVKVRAQSNPVIGPYNGK